MNDVFTVLGKALEFLQIKLPILGTSISIFHVALVALTAVIAIDIIKFLLTGD